VPLKEILAALKEVEGFRGLSEGGVREILTRPTGESPLEAKGSSIRVLPELTTLPTEPPSGLVKPKVLHLGLKPSLWAYVSVNGLRPRPSERAIRLYPDREVAMRAARRFCPNPTLTTVNLRQAEALGSIFTPYSERMWLVDELKPGALFGPPVPPKREETASEPEERVAVSGLFSEPAISRGKKKGKYEDAPEWKVMTRKDRRKGRS
jgi:hypothetical protein